MELLDFQIMPKYSQHTRKFINIFFQNDRVMLSTNQWTHFISEGCESVIQDFPPCRGRKQNKTKKTLFQSQYGR